MSEILLSEPKLECAQVFAGRMIKLHILHLHMLLV